MYEDIYTLNFKDTIQCFIQPNMHYFLLISSLEAYHKKTNPKDIYLKDRITELLEQNSKILPKLTQFIKDKLDYYVNTRNFIGHANLYSSKPIFDLNANPYKITELQKLMQLLLLKDLGYSDDVLLLLGVYPIH